MKSVLFVALRRLRPPLVFMIVVIAGATAGMALIPGIDAAGQPAHLSLFQAFYFVSYTASTIGFGEIPHPFTDRQRLFVTLVIYLSVLGWAYLVANILALVQDRGVQQAIVSARFARTVRRVREPFYILCGLGETGLTIVRALDDLDFRFIVLDVDEQRIQELELEQLAVDPPALAADARLPEVLIMAGLRKAECRGVLALSNDDQTNLAIGLAVQLLRPGLRTICRCHTAAVAASLAAIGVYQVINPFREFGEMLVVAARSPSTYRLLAWLTGLPGSQLPPRVPTPPGRWIVCGYGRFGTELVQAVRRGGFDVCVVHPEPEELPEGQLVAGRGTEAATLREAGIEAAAGIVAGTDDDTSNLAIALLARQLRPDIFVIARQNLLSNRLLFEACRANMTMVSSQIVANQCLAILRTRLLGEFLAIVRLREDAWADRLVERLCALVGEDSPHFWSCIVTQDEAPGLLDVMARSRRRFTLADLGRSLSDRSERSACIALLLVRGGGPRELPAPELEIEIGDALLFAGMREAEADQQLVLRNENYARYALLGQDELGGAVWRLLSRRRAERDAS